MERSDCRSYLSPDPWQLAKERYAEDLSKEEKAIFNGASAASLETYFYDASATEKINQANSKSRALLVKIQPFIASIEEYGKALDVYANITPLILGPLWGSIRVVLHLASSFEKYFERIVDMFERIGDVLPRFRAYQSLFSNHIRLLHALSQAYFDIIHFCSIAKCVFQKAKRSAGGVSLKFLWKPFNEKFAAILGTFRNHKENVEKEAGLAEMIEACEARAAEQENRELERMERKQETRRRLLALLSCIDYEGQHWKLCQRRQEGTGKWLLQDKNFEGWAGEDGSSSLWCYGIPGCGKTILTTSVVDSIINTDEPGTAAAFHYCDYSDSITLESTSVLGTIARQLLEKSDDIPNEVEQRINLSYKDGTRTPSAGDLISILASSLATFSKVFIVVDGLDECQSSARRTILLALKQLMRLEHTIVKLYVTSRDEADIRASFTDHFSIQLMEDNIMPDISHYVSEAVLSRRQSRLKCDDTLAREIVVALVEGARGMFLWVSFQLDEVCDALSEREIREALQNLPKDLAETYSRIMAKIKYSKNGSRRMFLAQKVFKWISCARRPLLIGELKEAAAFEPTDTVWDAEKIPSDGLALIQACGNLVVYDRNDDTVRLAHYTVQQFLTSDAIDGLVSELQFQLTEAEKYVGEMCVAYLSFGDFETQIAISENTFVEMRALEWALSNPLPHLGGFSRPIFTFWRNLQPESFNRKLPGINYGKYLGNRKRPTEKLRDKYLLLDYTVRNWVWHTSKFDDSVSLWGQFGSLALEKRMMFDFRMWDDSYTSSGLPYLPLFNWAVDNGHAPLLRLLSSPPRGLPLREYYFGGFEEGLSLKTRACRRGYRDVLDILMTASLGEGSNMLLWEAARCGHEEVVRMLVSKYGAMTESRDSEGLTGLSIAAVEGHNAVVKVFLGSDMHPTLQEEGTALCHAAKNGHLEVVKSLTVPARRFVGEVEEKALFLAVDNGHLGVAQFLVSYILAVAGDKQMFLYFAVDRGHGAVVQLLAENGWDVKAEVAEGWTALHLAAHRGQEEIVRMLVGYGSDVGAKDHDRRTALHLAAHRGQEEIVRMLVGYGSDVEAKDHDQRTALHLAATEGHDTVVKRLVDTGASVMTGDRDGRTALLLAALQGHKAVVQFLAKNGRDAVHDGRIALHRTASEGNVQTAQLLVECGIGIEATDPAGQTALHHAARGGSLEMVPWLLAEISNVWNNDELNDELGPLYYIAPRLQLEKERAIREKVVDAADNYGRTALHCAAAGGHGAVVQALLDNGADIEAKGKGGQTALHHAASMGRGSTVEILLSRGTNREAKDVNGWTALHVAARQGHGAMVQLLVDNGLDHVAEDVRGKIPLHHAALGGHPATVEIFLRMGINVTTPDYYRETPLHDAASEGHREVAQLLITSGADIDAVNIRHQTPLDMAASSRGGAVSSLLLDSGAETEATGRVVPCWCYAQLREGHIGPVETTRLSRWMFQ
ncbi:MAG: hypothetical protein M1813_008189 [Trichoglossum hirsutum]|nr:MAG: hypothetical protein M1813_008189 [Trichoglossum hirsutum]